MSNNNIQFILLNSLKTVSNLENELPNVTRCENPDEVLQFLKMITDYHNILICRPDHIEPLSTYLNDSTFHKVIVHGKYTVPPTLRNKMEAYEDERKIIGRVYMAAIDFYDLLRDQYVQTDECEFAYQLTDDIDQLLGHLKRRLHGF